RIVEGFGHDPIEDLARVIVSRRGVFTFVLANSVLLHLPTFVDGGAAPFGAPLGRAHRLAVYDGVTAIGVAAGQDAQRQPARVLDRRGERHVAPFAVGHDILARGGIAVDDEFDRHGARGTDAGALEIPIRGLGRILLGDRGAGLVLRFREIRRDARLDGDGT